MGTQAPFPKKGAEPSPQFSAHLYCGQTAGYIKMLLGMTVGLIPGDFVFDRDPDPRPEKGAEPPIFGPCLLRPNGCMDQGLSPGDFGLDGDPAAPSPKKRRSPLTIFGPCPLWPNGWMDQGDIWRGGGPCSTLHCAIWGPSSPP